MNELDYESVISGMEKLELEERLHMIRYIMVTYCGRTAPSFEVDVACQALQKLAQSEQEAMIEYILAVYD